MLHFLMKFIVNINILSLILYHLTQFTNFRQLALHSHSSVCSQTLTFNEAIEDENLQNCKEIYERIIDTTEKVLEILKGS